MAGKILLPLLLLSAILLASAQIPGIPAIPGIQIPGGLGPTLNPGQLSGVIDALRAAGFNLAGLILRGFSSFIPAYTTLMIPTNEAIRQFVNFNSTNVPALLLYHAILSVQDFSELQRFPVGARLPTMLPNNALLVTGNSPSDYTVNDVKVVRPNLCGNVSAFPVIACHGINGVLNPASLASIAPAGAPVAAGPGLSPAAAFQPPSSVVVPGTAIAPGAPPTPVTISPSGGAGANASAGEALHPGFGVLFLGLGFLVL